MSDSRAVAGKVVKSRREPAWTAIVIEPRQPRGSRGFAHLWKGLEQTGTHAQFRYLAGSRAVVGKVLISASVILVEQRPPRGSGRFVYLWEGLERAVTRVQGR
jgi:hypothetical protein